MNYGLCSVALYVSESRRITMKSLMAAAFLVFMLVSVSLARQGNEDNEYMFAKTVDKVSCVEPLMMRVKVIAVNIGKKECLIRVLSETFRNRYITLEHCPIHRKGGYVYGMYCSGQFSFLKGRLEKR